MTEDSEIEYEQSKDKRLLQKKSDGEGGGWGGVGGLFSKVLGWVPTCHPVSISKFSIFPPAEKTSLKSAARIFNHGRVMDELCILAALGDGVGGRRLDRRGSTGQIILPPVTMHVNRSPVSTLIHPDASCVTQVIKEPVLEMHCRNWELNPGVSGKITSLTSRLIVY